MSSRRNNIREINARYLIVILLLILIAGISENTKAQSNYGFRLLGRVLPGQAMASYGVGDTCFQGAGSTLQVYNMAVSSAPILLGQLYLDSQIEDIAVRGNYAYIADGPSGLVIANISSPSQMSISGHLALSSEAIGIALNGNYAYIADLDAGFVVADISDPAFPTLVSYSPTGHGALNIALKDNMAYLACGYGGLISFNIANPALPAQVAVVDTQDTWAYDVEINGNYAYMAYSLAETGGGLKVINVSNPSLPRVISDLILSVSLIRVDFNNNNIFAAAEDNGMRVIDVSISSNPRIIGGWTNGSGVNIAYSNNKAYLCGAEEGLRVINVTNPNFPQLEATCPTFSASQDVDVAGHYAFIAEKPSGLKVIDIQNLEIPHVLYNHQFYFENGAFQGVGEGVSIVGNYMYVVDFSDINGGYNDFRTYNITNPTQPESLGIYTNLPVSPRGQKIRDDIAYLATGRTIKILDVRDPQDIQLINSFEGDWHSAYWIDISGNYMYLATTNTGLRVLNISNEASPVIIGSYDTPGQAYSAKYHGGYVYIADYDSGLTIVDVSTPSAPTEVCRFTQYIGCFDVGFVENNSGSFAIVIFDNQVVALDIADPANPVEVAYYGEIDPHHLVTRGDTIYVADRMSGLHILALGPEDKIDNSGALPGKYFMARNYPNPFNSSTIIEFNQPSDGNVSIQIYDILGRKVANLFNGYLAKGLNRLNWNGTDNSRGQLTGGVYFYKIMSGAMSTTGKMILLK